MPALERSDRPPSYRRRGPHPPADRESLRWGRIGCIAFCSRRRQHTMSFHFLHSLSRRRPTSRVTRGLIAMAVLAMATTAWAALKSNSRFTLAELEQAPEMTPRQFANLFENFRFSYCPYVQPVEIFLRDQEGDCDDYAVLADHVLSGKGSHTRIVRVVLAGSDVAHAICYVTENKA